jgi:TrmH family RNA methyltransferase
MLSANQIKHWSSLRFKKNRYKHRQYLVEGETLVTEVIAARHVELQYVIGTSDYLATLSPETIQELGGKLQCSSEAIIGKISVLDSPSPVIAILGMQKERTGIQMPRGLSLYLDGIHDPGNLGTIQRAADWFGITQLFVSPDCVDVYNPKSIQASAGAFLRIGVDRHSLPEIRGAHPELEIVGTKIQGGADAFRHEWTKDTLLVIGSESHGIREDNHGYISRWLTIPRGTPHAGAESLNAALAAGILCATYVARK